MMLSYTGKVNEALAISKDTSAHFVNSVSGSIYSCLEIISNGKVMKLDGHEAIVLADWLHTLLPNEFQHIEETKKRITHF